MLFAGGSTDGGWVGKVDVVVVIIIILYLFRAGNTKGWVPAQYGREGGGGQHQG